MKGSEIDCHASEDEDVHDDEDDHGDEDKDQHVHDDEDDNEDDQCDEAFEINSTEINQILDEWSNFATEPENNQAILLEEGLWSKLSEEIVCNILACLPSRAQARFRCVCSRWDVLLSSSSPSIELEHCGQGKPRPSCMIIHDPDHFIFCHADHKWCNVPFDVSSCVDLRWKLVDASAGLLCYDCRLDGRTWVCVCNPMTRSYQVLPSKHPLSDSQMAHLGWVTVKLIVDRAAKAFKVILLPYAPRLPHTTQVFDSRTNSWADFHCVPSGCYDIINCSVLKNVIYCMTSHPNPNIFEVFDTDSGRWSQVEIEPPCSDFTMRGFSFTTNKDWVMLVDTNPRGGESVRVWKHLDNIPDNSIPVFSALRWERVEIELHPSLRSLVIEFEECFFDGGEYLCFTFWKTNRWLRYAFATRRWEVMPSGGAVYDLYGRWLVWEPGLDMILSSRGTFNYSDHPELERHHRSLKRAGVDRGHPNRRNF